MKQIVFEPMDCLRPTIDQARICGVIKENQEVQSHQGKEWNNGFVRGAIITALVIATLVLISEHYIEKKKEATPK